MISFQYQIWTPILFALYIRPDKPQQNTTKQVQFTSIIYRINLMMLQATLPLAYSLQWIPAFKFMISLL